MLVMEKGEFDFIHEGIVVSSRKTYVTVDMYIKSGYCYEYLTTELTSEKYKIVEESKNK